MAVEIPVVVDIFGAFANAAKDVKAAITPLESAVKAHPLGMSVVVDIAGAKTTLADLFTGASASAESFKIALAQVEARINKLAANGGFSLKNAELRAEEASLLDATMALEQALGRTTNASSTMARVFKINMQQAEVELAKYAESLNFLTKQQNFTAKGTNLYANREKKIAPINAKIQETRAYLASCSIELDKITQASTRAGVSMGRMITPAQAMAAAWERGHLALSRYNSSLGLTTGRLGMLLKSALQLVGLHAAFNFVRNIRQVTSEFELQRVALGGIIQDTERANDLFRQIKAAAIRSPFEIKDLVSYTKQLSAYRIETDKLFDVTMRLADVSAGLGVDMSRLILAYGQVRAASVLRGQELRQFTEAGIPLVDLLAEKFSKLNDRMVSTSEVFDLISKRAVPFSMIEEIFNDMTDAGGIFYKMQEKQSETLKGKWMKLKDAASIMYDEIGRTEAVHSAMEGLMDTFMKMLQNWRETGRAIGLAVPALVAYKVAMANAAIAANALTAAEAREISALELNAVGRSKVIAALFGETAATKVQVAVGNLYVAVKRKEIAATNLFTKALWRMIAALLKNPYAIAAAAIAALGVAIFRMVKASQEAKITVDELQKTIDSFKGARDTAKDIDELCNAYDTLSEKADKTAEEQKRLANMTKELANRFPEAIVGLDEETKRLKVNTAAIRERNAAILEGHKKALELSAEDAEREIAKLEAEQLRISEFLAKGTRPQIMPDGTVVEVSIPEKDLQKYRDQLNDIDGRLVELRKTAFDAKSALEGLVSAPVDAETTKSLSAWKETLQQIQKDKVAAGAPTIFSPDDITKMTSIRDLWKAVKKGVEETKTELDGLRNIQNNLTDPKLIESNQTAIALTEKQLDLYNAIIAAFGFVFKSSGGRGSGYTEDPFIQMMKDRMSYMKDFKKGYDDLSKYMSKENALARESEIMKTRGLALGIDVEQQKQAAGTLSEWYQQQINDAFAAAKKKGAKGATVTDFLSQQISDKSNAGKTLKAFQQLIQSLFDAKTDLDTTVLEDNLKKALDETSEKLKRSAQARNFFNDILAATGDEEVAATITMQVYGQTGDELKKRVQDEMLDALNNAQKFMSQTDYDFFKPLVDSFDIRQIQDNINKLPDTIKPIFERLISEQESFEADWFKNFYKTYSKTMSYAERIATVQDQAKKARTEAKERGVGKEGLAAIDTKEKQDIAGIRLEELKNSDEWVLAFENLEKVGKRSLEMLITRISEFIELSGSNLPVDQLRAIKKELEQVQTELEKRDPYRQAIDGIKDYIAALKAMAKARKMSNDDPKKEQALARAENARAKALVKIQNAAQGVGEQLSAMSNALSVFDEFLDLEDTSDAKAVLEGVATGIGILTAALTLLGAVLSFIQAIPIVAVITGIIVALASVAKVIANLKTAKLNRELEAQDAIIKNLERSYKRLSGAIEDAFGSEYIALYQQQLLNLEANEEAIKKKIAALEDARDDAKSGKKEKEYQEQIDGLNDELADVEQSIVDIKKDFQTFFAGTDITSAAKDFAQAWLDAYKSFGSTTAAMKEKFRDMIDNMVVSSLAARIVEGALEPVFNELAKWADEEGKISEEGIASVADVAAAQIDVINNQLGGVMEKLAGLGINMRGTGSTLTGISKDIAGASEESILGLAAGINTQNYYMSYMPTISQNVAAIVTLLGGENAISQPGTTLPETSTFGDELFRGQMSRIDENLALLVDLVRSVRSVKQSSTNTHVIAVTNN